MLVICLFERFLKILLLSLTLKKFCYRTANKSNCFLHTKLLKISSKGTDISSTTATRTGRELSLSIIFKTNHSWAFISTVISLRDISSLQWRGFISISIIVKWFFFNPLYRYYQFFKKYPICKWPSNRQAHCIAKWANIVGKTTQRRGLTR